MIDSETRVKIKEDARKQLNTNKNAMTIATVIVGLIALIPQILSEYIVTSYKICILINSIIILVETPLVIGLNIISLDCMKGEKVKVKDILKGFDRLYQAYGSMLNQYVIAFILTIPLALVPIILLDSSFVAISIMSIITGIASIFFFAIFSQTEFIIADKKDISILDSIKKSIDMIKGHILDYLIFTLSFIGWILLVAFTFGIAYIWVGPYMQMSYANFYNYIKEDKLNNYKKSKNKSLFTGILIGILLCGYTVVEESIKNELATPKVVKNVLNENNLKLISSDEETDYYITDKERKTFNINNEDYLAKYTVIVKNHPLNFKKYSNTDSTVLYIITDGNKVLGISCEPYDSKEKVDNHNTILGRYDIKGNALK